MIKLPSVPEQKHLYFLRHGHTFDPAPDTPLLTEDMPLTARGHQQAQQTADYLQGKIQFDAIFTSGLSRTLDTARPIAAQQKLPIQSLPQLNEISFNLESGDATFADILDAIRLLSVGLKTQPWEKVILGRRQPFADLLAGYMAAMTQVLQHPGDRILVVAHAGTNGIIISHLLGLPLYNWTNIHQHNCGLSMIQCRPPNKFSLQLMNFTVWDPVKAGPTP